jgi:bud site selection protein 31
MPPIRTARASKKAPPEGFEDIEDTLLEFQNKMKDAENASHEGKKKYEMTWPIFQITHQRSRYIYDLYYEKEAISKPLYDYLLKNGYADAMLIAKWKKQGYEKVSALEKKNRNRTLLTHASFAAHDASRPKRLISVPPVSAECRATNSKRTRTFNASTVGAEGAHQATERQAGWVPTLEWVFKGKKNTMPRVHTADGSSM